MPVLNNDCFFSPGFGFPGGGRWKVLRATASPSVLTQRHLLSLTSRLPWAAGRTPGRKEKEREGLAFRARPVEMSTLPSYNLPGSQPTCWHPPEVSEEDPGDLCPASLWSPLCGPGSGNDLATGPRGRAGAESGLPTAHGDSHSETHWATAQPGGRGHFRGPCQWSL